MKPDILLLGATGRVGAETLRLLRADERVRVIAAVRTPRQLAALEGQGIAARLLDLDRPQTLPAALLGITRALLLTGYSVRMLQQSKGFLEAAAAQGVRHILHIGASGAPTNEIPHWGWHRYVEVLIESLGFTWTHLRPEAYMQNVTGPRHRWLKGDAITSFFGNARWSWVDCLDIAAVAAECLCDPERFAGQVIPMGYELASIEEIAALFSKATGRRIRVDHQPPEAFLEAALAAGAEPAYMNSIYTQFRLDGQGLLPQGQVFDNFEAITGRAPARWAEVARRLGGTPWRPPPATLPQAAQ